MNNRHSVFKKMIMATAVLGAVASTSGDAIAAQPSPGMVLRQFAEFADLLDRGETRPPRQGKKETQRRRR